MACHARSNSLPTKSHSFVLKVEEELEKARSFVRTSSLSQEMILDAIKAVGRVYESINDILCMSSNQNEISQWQQRRWIEKELDESVRLLDICSTSRENFNAMKYCIQDQESAIRRGESKATKSNMQDLTNLVKNVCKDVKKHVSRKSEPLNEDALFCVSLITEARELTYSVLQAAFYSFANQVVEQKSKKWSLASKLLYTSHATNMGEKILDIDSMLISVEGLDNGLECLFRQLIQCRVALLNLCTL